MAIQIGRLGKALRSLIPGLFAGLLIEGCASGDPGELAGAVQLEQKAIICCLRTCGLPPPCFNVVCSGCECVPRPAGDGTACTADGQTGQCENGFCCPNCDDRNTCTKDSCVKGTCVHTKLDGESCVGGTCVAGQCCRGCVDKEGVCQASGSASDTATFCGLGGGACELCEDDGNPCTDDVCDQGKCQHLPRANGISCETDGNVCNGISTCVNGECTDGTPIACPAGNACVRFECDPIRGCTSSHTTDTCSDQNPCTTGDRCSGGVCQAGEPINCDDNEPCTKDSCNPNTGVCVHQPVAQDSTCDDGNDCTPVDRCRDGVCKGVTGTPCQDQNPCTINACDPSTETCHYDQLVQPGTACIIPTDKCRVNAQCDADGQCAGGVEKDCSDNDPCTSDDCDPSTGQCAHEPLDQIPCNDDSVCTVNDRCETGKCVGDPVECAALDDCHAPGTCDDETGLCSDPRLPGGSECASGTGTCDNGGRCQPNPSIGAGGEGAEAGASGGPGAEPAAGRGGDADGGAPGSAGDPADAGNSGESSLERGAPFLRDPGGCACQLPAAPKLNAISLLWLAAGLGFARRRFRRAVG